MDKKITTANTDANTGVIPPYEPGNVKKSKRRLHEVNKIYEGQPNANANANANEEEDNNAPFEKKVRTGVYNPGIERTVTVKEERDHFIDLNYVDEDRYWESLWFTIYGTDPRDIKSVEENEYAKLGKLTKSIFDYITSTQYCLVPSDTDIHDIDSRLNRILQGFHQEQFSKMTAVNTQYLIDKLKENVALDDGSTFFDLLIENLQEYSRKCFECSITRDSMCSEKCYSNRLKQGLTSCYDFLFPSRRTSKSATAEKGGRRTRRNKRNNKSKRRSNKGNKKTKRRNHSRRNFAR